jgi:hypothetical protein
MITKDMCTRRVRKVGNNNVVVEYLLKDKDGKDVVFDRLTEHYGADILASARQSAEQKKADWQSVDATRIAKEVAACDAELAKLDDVETEMNKVSPSL